MPLQEISGGRKVFSGNVVLGASPEPVVNRIANEVYSSARAGKLDVPGFPDFGPTVTALTSSQQRQPSRSDYKVCLHKGDKLMLLESSSKWLSLDQTKDRAQSLFDSHNQKYNPGGEFWVRTDSKHWNLFVWRTF